MNLSSIRPRIQTQLFKGRPQCATILRACAHSIEQDGTIFVDVDSDCWKNWLGECSGTPGVDVDPIKRAWYMVKWTFEKAQQAQSLSKSLISRGVSDNRVDPETFSLRVLQCHGDNQTAPCQYRSYSEKGKYHFCNACGCGEREMAALDIIGASEPNIPSVAYDGEYTKLHYPHLECPAKRPGFSNAAK